METIEKQIEAEASVSVVYSPWSHFEQFPRFMECVQSVEPVDNHHIHWVAEVGGQKKEWDDENVERVQAWKIARRSTRDAVNSGQVDFEARDPEHTRISLRMDYEPQGRMERMGSSPGVLSRRIEGDLERFKEYI